MSFRLIDLMGGVWIYVQTILRSAGFVDQGGGQEGECGEEADEEALHCSGFRSEGYGEGAGACVWPYSFWQLLAEVSFFCSIRCWISGLRLSPLSSLNLPLTFAGLYSRSRSETYSASTTERQCNIYVS